MALIGSIEHFNPEKDFADYSERMEQFFIVNSIENDMKVPMLITLIGPETYNVLKNLVSPEKPSQKTYTDLIEALTKHYVVNKSAIAGRYEFYRCKQKEGQSVNEFVVEIKGKAALCKFGSFLEEALRDRLVCGLIQEHLVKKLLTVGDGLSFAEAVKIASAYESAEKETKNIQPVGSVSAIKKPVPGQSRTPVHVNVRHPMKYRDNMQGNDNRKQNIKEENPHYARECSRCGGSHTADRCFKKTWTCYNCQRQGHIATKCHFRPAGERNVLRQLDEQDNAEKDQDGEEVILGSIQNIDSGDEEAAWLPL